jgi:hypothetical protein
MEQTMEMIPATMVDSVARRLECLGEAGSTQMLEELSISQPTPTGFVVALSRLGLPMSELDHVVHLLLVIAECFRRKVGKPLPKISDEMLEAAARKVNAMGKLLQDGDDQAERMTGLVVESHKERNLFAYVLGYLDEHGLTRPSKIHEHAVFAAAVAIEVFMQAARLDEDAAK